MRNGAFSGCHPTVNFVYFALVLTCTMVILHPVCLAISLVCSIAYAAVLGGRKALRRGAKYLLPMMLVAALLNPLFNHRGVTILCYLPGGNPLTLESVLYGAAAAVMLAAALCWFSCFGMVMTTDKLLCLFGRAAPAFSLLISMVLRFVPALAAQLKAVSDAQRYMVPRGERESVLRRARRGARMLSILVTWALENAVETADSMKSRGYGLPGRTAFSIFRFDRRDLTLLCLIAAAGGTVLEGVLAGGLYWNYYPAVRFGTAGPFSAAVPASYAFLCALPLILESVEDLKWTALQSKT